MGFFNRFRNNQERSVFKMITETTRGYYAWNGNIYQSDIVRSCIRPSALAASKLTVQHIRETVVDGQTRIEVNPEPYLRLLLSEPNPYMSMSKLLEKLNIQLKLNNNAFALIVRDANDYPVQILPISCSSAEAVYSANNELYLHFLMPDGKGYTFPYTDIIHLRRDYNNNSLFGESNVEALRPLMEIVTTTDQGIVGAIKNSSVIRWLLKFHTPQRPEDIRSHTKEFAEQFLSIENGTGVAGVDAKADATQISPQDYVPNAAQMDRITARIHSFFGVSENIVQNKANEDEMNSWFEGDTEPFIIDVQEEFTRKIFSRRARGWGNKIVCDAGMVNAASLQTKLSYVAMVDRGAMTPNEWRKTFNLAPLPGGDEPIRRLDTAPVSGEGGA